MRKYRLKIRNITAAAKLINISYGKLYRFVTGEKSIDLKTFLILEDLGLAEIEKIPDPKRPEDYLPDVERAEVIEVLSRYSTSENSAGLLVKRLKYHGAYMKGACMVCFKLVCKCSTMLANKNQQMLIPHERSGEDKYSIEESRPL